jgi:hypothetical protein
MTIKNWVRTGTACAALAGAFSSTAADAADFVFDDVHYWIGEGTNQAAIVLDWNNGRPGSSLVWGVRWNGPSTNLTSILGRLDDEDKRLASAIIQDSWGSWVLGFGYDADGDGGVFNAVSPGVATDRDDFVAMDDFSSTHYWSVVVTNVAAITGTMTWNYTMVGIDELRPANGDWFAFKRINWQTGESSFPALPAAAESPFAHRVVASLRDPYERFTDPNTVLGPPARVSDIDNSMPGLSAPVTPANPAMREDQLFALSWVERDYGDEPGYVTVAFDHRVVDDPQNPYGLDFIVFGNALHDIGGEQYFYGTDDPNGVTVATADILAEPGIVEVSQNGTTWFTYGSGPFADAFAPTLGHLYDTNAPDASLFAGNRWWGKPADPTLPVDPALTSTNFVDRTLAGYAVLYNGSAGGTGFDIGAFALPVDPATGRKWIQYVRVRGGSNLKDADWTDIDAFADVAPAAPYDNWAREHYAWTNLPNNAIAGKRAIAANGKPNFYNAAFGTAPDAAPVEAFKAIGFAIENGRAVFRVPSAEFAFDAFRVGRASVVDGLYRDVLPTFESAVQTPEGFESVFSIPIDPTAAKAFYKIGISGE